MKTNNTSKSSRSLFKYLALAMALGVGSAYGQITEVGGAGVIGDTVLTTNAGTAILPQSGYWRANGQNANNSILASPASLAVTATGNVSLTFTHRYNFENGWDGGAVYISVNGNPAIYLDGTAFSSNGYVGDTLANGGSAWTGGENVFYGKSAGYDTPALITSVADLGSLNSGDIVSVEFKGEWDNGGLNTPPNWEIGTVKLTDVAAADILDVNFDNGDASFAVSGTATTGIWGYSTVAQVSKFELDAAADTADRYAPDIPGSIIDLTGAIINVTLLNGTLLNGDTFSLFDLSGGTTLTGTPASVSLPGNIIWTNNIATNGTITVAQLPASGTWTADANGNWSDTTKWAGGPPGVVAFGTDNTADFTLNLAGNRTVTLDANFSIGNIIKQDTNGANNTLSIGGTSTSTLTLDVTTGSPTITNNDTGSNGRIEITRPIASDDGLTIAGGGYVRLTNNNSSYTGATSITGVLDFGGISSANIGGGTGRNITASAGSGIRFNVLSNAFLNRLVETTDEITVMTGATANNIDFSSNTGANLPNAFLGNYVTNNGKTEYKGTFTPAGDTYRLGGPLCNGVLGLTFDGSTSAIMVDEVNPRSLLVGAAAGAGCVETVCENTFSGDTRIRTGGKLLLGNPLALQNSALDTDSGVGDYQGRLYLSNGIATGRIANSIAVPNPTLGGLKGSRNLKTTVIPGGAPNSNNTGGLALTAMTGFTLNVGASKTCTYSGAIGEFAVGTTLTLIGPGTQVLSGANLYTGATNVNQGTLALVDGSHASPITVASGASLGFTLLSPTTSTSSVDLTNGTVKITGAVNNVDDYLLMTASTFTGSPMLDSPITDYALQKLAGDTELWLVYTGGGGDDYSTWATDNGIGGALFGDDFDKDGISNGVEYALGLNPMTSSQPPGALSGNTITFTKGSDAITNADVSWIIETSTTLEAGSWTDEVTQTAGDATATISYTFTPGSPAKKFARLKAVKAP